MPSTQEIVDEELEKITEEDGVTGAAVVRQDGLLIASDLGEDINEDQVGAMTASTVGSGDTASDSVGIGEVKGVTVEARQGKIISMSAGEEGILVIVTDAETGIGDIKDVVMDAGSTIAGEL
ncbi:MAG: roadblock/LC7 domain-containing protein [Candidatus Nanohaloarchaea archaeon]